MAIPLVVWAIGLAATAWGAKTVFSKETPKRGPGDYAQVGDEVFVSQTFLPQTTLPQLPPGTLYVQVKVKGGDKDRVQGPIVGFGDQKVPAEVGAYVVQRKDIFRVMRNGATIADQPAAKIGADG